jgi:phage FluMu protein Com
MPDSLYCDKCNRKLAEADGVIIMIKCKNNKCKHVNKFKIFGNQFEAIEKIRNVLELEKTS